MPRKTTNVSGSGSEMNVDDAVPTPARSRQKSGKSDSRRDDNTPASSSLLGNKDRTTTDDDESDGEFPLEQRPNEDEMNDFMSAIIAAASGGTGGATGAQSRSSLFNAMFGGGTSAGSSFGDAGGAGGSSNTAVIASTGKYAELLGQIRNKKNPTMQTIALQELAEILSVATEDMFVGYGQSRLSGFNTREYCEALVSLLVVGPSGPGANFDEAQFMMEDDAFGEFSNFGGDGNAMAGEVMLLGCRCLANLLEANPGASTFIVQNEGVKTLISKLTEIEYIELAEQVLAVLDKICIDYPFAIVKENGLMACLQYLDFFSLHVQRLAVAIVAKSCAGLGILVPDSDRSRDIFSKVQEITPILETLISTNSDSRIMENCVATVESIVSWSHSHTQTLESIATPELLTAIVTVMMSAATSTSVGLHGSGGSSNSLGGTPVPSSSFGASGGPTSGAVNAGVFTRLVRILLAVCKGSAIRRSELVGSEDGVVKAIYTYLSGTDNHQLDSARSDSAESLFSPSRVSAIVANSGVSKGASEQVVQVLMLASRLFPDLPKDGVWCMRLKIPVPTSGSETKGKKKKSSAKTPEKSTETSQSSRTLRSSSSSSKIPISAKPIPARRTNSSNLPTELPNETSSRPVSSLKSAVEVNETVLTQYAQRILPVMIEVFSTTIQPQIRRLSLECISKAICFCSDSECLYSVIIGDTSNSDSGFGRLIYELLGMRGAANLSSCSDSEKFLPANSAECGDALLFVAVAVVLTQIIVEKCGSRVAGWLIREGILSEIRKCVQDLETGTSAIAITDGENIDESNSDSGQASFLDGMKLALDKITGAAVSALPAGPEATSNARSISVVGIDGEKYNYSEVRIWMLDFATSFLNELGEKKILSIAGSSSGIMVLDDLKKNASNLKGFKLMAAPSKNIAAASSSKSNSESLMLADLQKVGQHFAGLSSDKESGTIGVTGFEVLESGIIDGLISYLTHPAIGESIGDPSLVGPLVHQAPLLSRLQAFLHIFLDGPNPLKNSPSYFVPTAFKNFVFRLQECLSREEDFRLSVAVPANSSNQTVPFGGLSSLFGIGSSQAASMRELVNPALQLSRQLRVKLIAVDEDDGTPGSSRSFMVSIHAVATFKSFEDFLRTKVGGFIEKSDNSDSVEDRENEVDRQNGNTVGNESEKEDDDDDDDEENDEDEDENDEEFLDLGDIMDTDEGNNAISATQATPVDVIPPPSPTKNSDPKSPTREDSPSKSSSASKSFRARSPKKLDGIHSPKKIASDSTPKSIVSSAVNPISISYAGAASRNNFTLKFFLGDVEVPSDSTVFGALYRHELSLIASSDEKIVPDIWRKSYVVNFKRVKVVEEAVLVEKKADSFGQEKISPTQSPVKVPFPLQIPAEMRPKSLTGRIIFLLRVLYDLNTKWQEIYDQAALSSSKEIPIVGGVATAADGASNNTDFSHQIHAPVLSILSPLPTMSFMNSKITAKFNRQLNEPLIVAGSVLPNWSHQIASEFSFLVPFESRVTYLQSTAFGYARSIARWRQSKISDSNSGGSRLRQSAADVAAAMIGRIPRQKVRIARTRIVDSMIKIMDLYSKNPASIEVEFFDEVGTGLGPTLEFYSSVCAELRKKTGISMISIPDASSMHSLSGAAVNVILWRQGDATGDFLNPVEGLFPAPMSSQLASSQEGKNRLALLKAIGTFVAKALLDGRVIDLPFNPIFLDMVVYGRQVSLTDGVPVCLHLLKHVDANLFSALSDIYEFAVAKVSVENNGDLSELEKISALNAIRIKGARIEDLCLDFTLPGYPNIALKSDGLDVALTLENVREYVECVLDLTIGNGIAAQIDAFRDGFNRVFSISNLRCFFVHELELFFGGSADEDWSYMTILDSIKADHGYTHDSKIVQNLVDMMSSFTISERREFLTFVTGSPKLPIGGFKALNPLLTVVKKSAEFPGTSADLYLPSVMTCVNYLKVPAYSNAEIMRARFDVAIKEGQGSFHLS